MGSVGACRSRGAGGSASAPGAHLGGRARASRGCACALACSAGGALALLPCAWSLLGLHLPGDTYLWMALTEMVFLGWVIVPFHWMGAIIARGIGGGAAVEKR